jgi:hypothetical protein
MTNGNEMAIEGMKRELRRALGDTCVDLERVEILSAGLAAFSKPIPEYQPGFLHLDRLSLTSYKIGSNR